jgi:hypothetical protein
MFSSCHQVFQVDCRALAWQNVSGGTGNLVFTRSIGTIYRTRRNHFMSFRHVTKAGLAAGTMAAASMAAILGLAGPAGADLTNGNVTISAQTSPTPAAGTPYSSGQQINVVITANSTLSSANLSTFGFPGGVASLSLLECADPGGTVANLPTKPSECEPATVLTTTANKPDGSLSLTGSNGYTMYDLPDPGTLGVSNGTVCGQAPNFCVVGIFSNYNNFSDPDLFSAPFQIAVGDGSDTGDNPGDGTPEVPWAIGLPLAAMAIAGGSVLLVRRSRKRATSQVA